MAVEQGRIAGAPAAPEPQAETGVEADFDTFEGYCVLTVQMGRLAMPVRVTIPNLAIKGIAGNLLMREVQRALQTRLHMRPPGA